MNRRDPAECKPCKPSKKARGLVPVLAGVCVLSLAVRVLCESAFVGLVGTRPLRQFDVGDIESVAGLCLPAHTRLVDAYVAPFFMDGTYYARVDMPRPEIQEFIQQETLRSGLRPGNAMLDHLSGVLERRWNYLYRARDCRSWEGKTSNPDLMSAVVTICLDNRDRAVVYLCLVEG